MRALFTRRCGSFIAACLVIVTSSGSFAADRRDSVLHHLPAGGFAAVEVSGLRPLLEKFQSSDVYRKLLASPTFQTWSDRDLGKKFRGGQAIIEAQLGQDVWTLAKNYLGGRMALAVYPPTNRSEPDTLLLIEAKDAAAVAYLKEKLIPLLSLAGDAVMPSDRADGGWQFTYPGGNTAVLTGAWILSSNNSSLLEMTAAQLKTPAADSLAQAPLRQTMIRHLGADHLVQGWVDLAWIAQQRGERLLPEKLDNPVGSLLLGGLFELVANSPYAAVTVDIGENDYRLCLGVQGKVQDLTAAHQGYFQTENTTETIAVPQLSGKLGGISFYRDVQAWYQQREALMVPRLMPEFDKFETGLGNLLPGKDFGTEVLPLLGKRWTFVAAPQTFSHLNGRPGVQLPAFGMLIDLAQPQEGADLMQMFFQTIAAIVNIEAGQRGRQPWVVTSESYKDVQISFAKYLEQPKGDSLPLAYNFQPAMARVGNQFLATTSTELCRSLIDTLKTPPTTSTTVPSSATDNLILEITPTVAAELLQRNESLMVAQSVQSGKTTERAHQEFQSLMELLHHLRPVSLRNHFDAESIRLELTGGWK